MTANAAAAIDILGRLVKFDTTSRNSNLALVDWVRNYLAHHGIEAQIFPNAAGDKANLLATIGPADRPGIVLAGHTDVVPVDGQAWSSDPFTVTERDGLLYGRGTADMKSWAALALTFVPAFLEQPLRLPVHLALTYDEETTCDGAVALSDILASLPVRPQACVVGEPSGMRVVTGQKGTYCYTATIKGLGAHSSLAPHGVNAVEYACRLIVFLEDLNALFADQGPRDEGYDVPFSTVTVGTIAGGTALNIVPEGCTFDFSTRMLPGHDHRDIENRVRQFVDTDLLPQMTAISPAASVEIDPWPGFAGYELDPDAEIVQFVRALSGHNQDLKVSYFTEAGIYTDAGRVPSLICGPGYIEQAHKPDEFVSIAQIEEGVRFMERLTRHLHGCA